MPKTLTAFLAGVVALATLASAEIRRPNVRGTAATTNTWTTLGTDATRGILHKLEITVSGSTATVDVWVADADDNSLLASNTYASGSTVIVTNLAVVGITVKTQNANTNAATVTVKPTLEQ